MVPHTVSSVTSTTPRVLPTEGDRLVLSPHLDDALLSAYAAVTDSECEVWTVFAGRPVPPQTTSWDLSCGFANSDETLSARLAEDVQAFAGLPATVRRLEALEGAYVTPPRRARDLHDVRQELMSWLNEHPRAVIFIPAGAGIAVPEAPWRRLRAAFRRIDRTSSPTSTASLSEPSGARLFDAEGHAAASPRWHRLKQVAKKPLQRALHLEYTWRRRRSMRAPGSLAANPDHLALRDLVVSTATEHNASQNADDSVQVILYEELPYLWHAPADAEVARLMMRTGWSAESVTMSIDPALKHRHLSRYVSQMPVMDKAGRLTTPETLPTLERYWVLRPHQS